MQANVGFKYATFTDLQGYILTDFHSFLEFSKMFHVEAKVICDVVFNIHRGNNRRQLYYKQERFKKQS